MSHHLFLRSYWGARTETQERLAERLESFLTALSTCDPSLTQWFRKGNTKAVALRQPVALDQTHLIDVIQSGRRGDRPADKELGFRFGLWTGQDGQAHLEIACGITSPLFPNFCLLYFPNDEEITRRLLERDKLLALLEAVVRSWEPDWAHVSSRELEQAVGWPTRSKTTALPGWLVYLSAARGRVPRLPPPTRVVPMAPLGSAVLVGEEIRWHTPEESVEAVRRTMEALGESGLLGRSS